MKNKNNFIASTILLSSILSITACGGGGDSAPAATTPTPTPTNVVPTASAGTDQTVESGSGTVTLTGSGTDTDGSISSYSWSVSGGAVTITDSSLASATFAAPTVSTDTTLTFTLTVTDDGGATATDDVVVTVTATNALTSTLDSSWAVLNRAPDAIDIVYTGTKYIAVGTNGYLAESADGQSWTDIDLGIAVPFAELAMNGSNIVAIPLSNSNLLAVALTTDGTNWQLVDRTGTTDCNQLNSISHDGSQFVGTFSNNNICTSTDGVAWQLQSTQISNINKIVFGSGKYALLISDGLVTMDALDVTSWNVPTLPSTGAFSDLIYNNSTFVGVRGGEVIYSTDGLNWSAATGLNVSANIASISYSADKGFVAISADNSPIVYSSADGSSWTLINNDLPLFSGNFSKIVNGSAETLLFTTEDTIYSSTDQISWGLASTPNQPTGPISLYFKHNNTVFALGSGNTSVLHISTDNGVTWSISSDVMVGGITSIIHDGTRFIASGGSGVSTSTDGTTWNSAIAYDTTTPITASVKLGATTYNFSDAGNFDTNKTVLTSDDGITFQLDSGLLAAIPSNFLGNVKQAISNGSVLVGITDSTIVSFDGTTWSAPEQSISADLRDVIWDGSRFVVVGAGGVIKTSTDGLTWTTQAWFNNTMTITDVLAVGSSLYATDINGIVASSSDGGVTWIERKDFSSSNIVIGQLAHDGTSFYGFGRNSVLNSESLATSVDGTIWSAGSAIFDSVIPDSHVDYDTGSSRFVSAAILISVSASEPDMVYASSDAANWALSTQIPTDASYAYSATQKSLAGLAYGVINVTNGTPDTYTSGSAAYSEDGINWVLKTDQIAYSGYTPASGIYARLASTVEVSADGVNYSAATVTGLSSVSETFNYIKYVNGQYVGVVFDNGGTAENTSIYTSSDGSNWVFHVKMDLGFATNAPIQDIEHDGTQYIFVFPMADLFGGVSKGTMIITTPDLQNLTLLETGIRPTMTDLVVETSGYTLLGSDAIIATHAFY